MPNASARERNYAGAREDITLSATNEYVEWQASELMHGGREAIILHNGERYRLRITAQQRLILTK